MDEQISTFPKIFDVLDCSRIDVMFAEYVLINRAFAHELVKMVIDHVFDYASDTFDDIHVDCVFSFHCVFDT